MPWTILALALSLFGGTAWAAEDCATPRSAADSLLVWTRSRSFDPARASACLDVPPGADGPALALQLKQVLDARGLSVPVASLPNEPGWTDAEGRATVLPLPERFPGFAIERAPDGRWLIARETLEAVPDLYADTYSPVGLWFQSVLPAAFSRRMFGIYLWQVLYAGLLVLAATATGTAIRMLLGGQVRRLAQRAGLQLDPHDYARTNGPLVALVVSGMIAWGIPDLRLPASLSGTLLHLANLAVVASALLVASRFVGVIARVAQHRALTTANRVDDQLIPLLRQAGQALVVALGGLYLIDAVGFDVWKLAAGLGLGGLAFALAAQDTVANLFGSFNIFVDHPFQVGDWVIIGEVEGVVEEVGFRSTRVRTFHNSLVTIPNSQITNTNVDNMGLRARRRVKLMLSLTYDTPADKLEAYVEGVRAILAAHPDVQRSYEAHVYQISASSIDVLVYFHVVVPDWHTELVARSQTLLEFIRLAEAMQVDFAFPSTSVYVRASPSEPLPAHPDQGLDELGAIADSFGPGGGRARPGGPRFPRSWSVQARERQAGSVGIDGQT